MGEFDPVPLFRVMTILTGAVAVFSIGFGLLRSVLFGEGDSSGLADD